MIVIEYYKNSDLFSISRKHYYYFGEIINIYSSVLFLWKCLLSISRKKVHILWNEKNLLLMILFCDLFFLKCLSYYYYYYILRFVLYDDGELTYSVDDHYDTIPQAVINLNNVFEITEADAITGNIIIHIGLKMLNFCAMHHVRTWVFLTRQK